MHKRFFSEQTRYRRRRKAQRRREQREAAHAAHPLRTSLPFLCLSGVVLAGAITAASCTLCYQVEAQGQTLAFFQDPGTYDQAVAQAEDRASQILEAPVSLNQDLTLTTALAPKDQIESLSGVTSSILESIPQLDHVYTLTVDGTTVGVNGDADVITQALNLVKEHYTTDETRSLYIESQVDIRYEYLPAGQEESTAEEMAQTMLATSPRTFDYTVQEGDTLESVTALFSMTEERFRALNSDLTLTTEVTLASSPLSATTQAGGLTLAYPAGFEVLEEDGGVGVYREDVLVRFEDVQQAQERLLEAGYSSAEAAEALLEAGYQLVTGEEAAGMGTVLDQGEGVLGLEFALDSGNAPLRCQLQLFTLKDRLVLGMLVCEQDGLSGGQSLYQALRQGLQLSD